MFLTCQIGIHASQYIGARSIYQVELNLAQHACFEDEGLQSIGIGVTAY
jgi:hypothetical protein